MDTPTLVQNAFFAYQALHLGLTQIRSRCDGGSMHCPLPIKVCLGSRVIAYQALHLGLTQIIEVVVHDGGSVHCPLPIKVCLGSRVIAYQALQFHVKGVKAIIILSL